MASGINNEIPLVFGEINDAVGSDLRIKDFNQFYAGQRGRIRMKMQAMV